VVREENETCSQVVSVEYRS
jgi:hypothetical protein